MPTVPINDVISALNSWGARFADIAGSMFVQSAVVAVVLLAAVWACSRTQAALRYGLLMLLPLKLLLPPSLSFPTGLAYWIQQPKPHTQTEPLFAATVSGNVENRIASVTTPALSTEGVLFLLWTSGIGVLSAFIVFRYRQVGRLTGTPASAELQRELDACRAQMGVRRMLRLETSTTCTSPAVSGLLRPIILIPKGLAEKLTPAQLRHVLLHELAHVKRGDLWVNHLQVVLQVLHWFNPLLWVANSVTRRVREEAVDDLVMARLGPEAPNYPATLVAVARMAFTRPRLRLGFIGIMESKAALKRRVTRLVQNPVGPAKLGWARTGLIAATAAVLLPMARPSLSDNGMATQKGAPTNSATNTVARIYTMENTITVWDAVSGRKLQSFPADTNAMLSVTFSPDGRWVASGNGIRIWDVTNGNVLATGESKSKVVRSIMFSPDGKRLFVSNTNGSLRLWEFAPGGLRHGTNSPAESPSRTIRTETGLTSDPQISDP